MTNIIHLETEQAWQVNARLKNSAADLQALYSRLQRDRSRLERAWHSPTATRYMGQLDNLLARLDAQVERLYRLEGRLGREIEEWITVDQGHPFGKAGGAGGGSAGWGSGYFTGGGGGGSRGGGWSGGGGGGGGGGGVGGDYQPDGDELGEHTEYELLRGIQMQYYEKYMEGEMTWEEAMQAMEEEWEKDPFKRDWVNVEGEIWKKEGAVDGYVWRDRFLDDHVEVGLLGYELKGTAKVGLNKDGLEGKLGGEAGLYLGKAEADYEIIGITAAGVAYAGATAAGDIHANLQNPITGKVGAGAEVDAFVGGKAGGTISRDFEDLGIPVEVGATGSVSYGLGIHAEADIGMEQGVVSVEFEYGATLGLGAQGGINFKIDVISAAEKAVDIGEAVVDWLW